MLFKPVGQFAANPGRFNMTPIIDVVFLLIIFFMLVCQFIVAENFPVSVPDNCRNAQSNPERSSGVTTVTVMKNSGDGTVSFAVGSEKITAPNSSALVDKITEAIDKQLDGVQTSPKLVCLRIDKDIRFAHSQYALAAVAQSSAAKIQFAALKNKDHHTK